MATFQIRDPVHGFVNLNDQEIKIVNTRIFQRLRGIKQLAMASLVYPGAVHTRFEHSLGVYHIARLLSEKLIEDEDDRKIVWLAALVHDIGHGPFSHVSEIALELFYDEEKIKPKKTEKIHEMITKNILDHDDSFQGALRKDKTRKISRLLSEGYAEPLMRHIVSGPLDADKQDYLLRDSQYCGVEYGVFDIHQLRNSLMAGIQANEQWLMISQDGIHAVEQYILAKYYLSTQVYQHKVRLITDQMLTRAIVLGIVEDKLPELEKIYKYDGSDCFIQNYLKWDDARFLLTFSDEKYKGKYVNKLTKRLIERRLLKQVFSEKISKLDLKREVKDFIPDITLRENRDIRCTLEEKLSKAIEKACRDTEGCGPEKIDKNLVIIHTYSIKSIREQARNDEKGLYVNHIKGPIDFEEESILFKNISKSMDEPFLEVYSPVMYDHPKDREKLIIKLKGEIERIINETEVPLLEEESKEEGEG